MNSNEENAQSSSDFLKDILLSKWVTVLISAFFVAIINDLYWGERKKTEFEISQLEHKIRIATEIRSALVSILNNTELYRELQHELKQLKLKAGKLESNSLEREVTIVELKHKLTAMSQADSNFNLALNNYSSLNSEVESYFGDEVVELAAKLRASISEFNTDMNEDDKNRVFDNIYNDWKPLRNAIHGEINDMRKSVLDKR